jgi:1-acyl-sn-glycerol-3-phosphate acyltransferase
MKAVGMVPIDRGDADAARAALNTGVRVLHEGTLLGIYPEGTRSPDGRLYRGKTGVARLALESGAVVVPCAMVNTDVIQPPGRLFPKLRPRPGVVFGKPLDFSRYEGMSGDRFVERSMTDEIMYELMQLSGQEYVDQYAAKVKAAEGKDVGFGSRERDAVREIGDRVPGTRAS